MRFPPSVREWYALEDAMKLLADNCEESDPVPLDQLGSSEEAGLGWFHVMSDREGISSWYVRLDGSDDPPVDVCDEYSRPPFDLTESPWSSTFSVYVYDLVSSAAVGGRRLGLQLDAKDKRPDEADLERLRAHMKEGPRTKGDAVRLTTYRFFNVDGLVTFQADPAVDGEGETQHGDWTVQARTAESLYNLCELVWPIGTLSETLECKWNYSIDDPAVDVLRRLGRTIEPRCPAGGLRRGHWKEAFGSVLLSAAIVLPILFAGWLALMATFALIGSWAAMRASALRAAAFFAVFWVALVGLMLGVLALDWLAWIVRGGRYADTPPAPEAEED